MGSQADITSRHNPRLKQAIALRDSRRRREAGRFLIDGARETLRALQAGVEPIEVYLADKKPPSDGDSRPGSTRVEEALAALAAADTPVYRVAPNAFAKLAYGDRTDGVVLVAAAPSRTLGELALPANPLVVVVEGIEKPGNLGAILRTADGAGADAVIVCDARVDLFNANVLRSSVGAALRDNVAIAEGGETRRWLSENGLRVLVTRPEASQTYSQADCTGPTAIVLGSEAGGLTTAWDDPAGAVAVRLPMRGVADSLNVSTTAAVLLYEAQRQRGTAP